MANASHRLATTRRCRSGMPLMAITSPACDNKTVQVWDAANGDHLYIHYGHTDFVYAVAWSPDGKHIASAGDDKTVQVWDATSGNLFSTYTGHSRGVRAVAWATDSRRIASGSWDKTVQVWQAE